MALWESTAHVTGFANSRYGSTPEAAERAAWVWALAMKGPDGRQRVSDAVPVDRAECDHCGDDVPAGRLVADDCDMGRIHCRRCVDEMARCRDALRSARRVG